MHQQKLEYFPHRSELERNDSPQRSCTSLALGLPTSRGGWQGPGGTAGVWTCRVSDSLQGKTTHQLRPRENIKLTTSHPASLSFPHHTNALDKDCRFTQLIRPSPATADQKPHKYECIVQSYIGMKRDILCSSQSSG